MVKENRVVVTGVGIISPNGVGKEAFWEALLNGVSGIRELTRFDSSEFESKIAGEVEDFNECKYIPPKKAKRMGRLNKLGLVATALALEDAGLEPSDYQREKTGVVVGTAIGDVELAEAQYQIFHQKGIKGLNPFLSMGIAPASILGEIVEHFKIPGYGLVISTGCSSGLNAVGHAFEVIKSGQAEIILAGGVEAPLSPVTFGTYNLLHQLSLRNESPEEASRPYEKTRDGFVMSEGAGMLVLETLESAFRRNARVYGEIKGYGSTYDVYKSYQMEISGQKSAEAIRLALEEAGVGLEEIDYINAHGSSTPTADKKETNAIKLVFQDLAYDIPVSSIKSMIGHPFGAAGPLQVAAAMLVMQDGVIPPTINYQEKDPECDLDYVPNYPREEEVETSLVNSYGLGGNNSVVVVTKI
jgi:3-oxoacyl-[acyl-carrier-protein] synthase II